MFAPGREKMRFAAGGCLGRKSGQNNSNNERVIHRTLTSLVFARFLPRFLLNPSSYRGLEFKSGPNKEGFSFEDSRMVLWHHAAVFSVSGEIKRNVDFADETAPALPVNRRSLSF